MVDPLKVGTANIIIVVIIVVLIIVIIIVSIVIIIINQVRISHDPFLSTSLIHGLNQRQSHQKVLARTTRPDAAWF